MTIAEEWDLLYRANTHMSIWPWSDMVAYVNRYAKPSQGFKRVLELGCGAGANIPFFVNLKTDYYGIEGSSAIVALLHESFPELTDKIVVGDFTQTIAFDGLFDLVVDRASVTHNTTEEIQRTFDMVIDKLRSGGRYIGIDWFSTTYSDAKMGDALDVHTRTNITIGQFAGLGPVHFSDKDHLVGLLMVAGFEVERLEHKESNIIVPADGGRKGWWNFVAVKP
jgi:SAM-dependent methyltransferase